MTMADAEATKAAPIFALKTTSNREDQVMDFLISHVERKKLDVYSIVRGHGMRGYIFVEAPTREIAEEASYGIPYAKGLLDKTVEIKEIEPMIEQQKQVMNIKKFDIVEIIAGPFKREKAKVQRVDKTKEEVVVELLEAAVPIPMTLKLDAVHVIRREDEEEDKADDDD